MGKAYDFSIVPGPDPQSLKDAGAEGILVYSFAFRQPDWYLDEIRRLGMKVVWIWERNTDSIFGGYDYAVGECEYHETRVKPGELTYVACDTRSPGDVTPFLRGWADTTRESIFGIYGPDFAIAQAQELGGKCQRYWGVVNWIVGGGPNNAPENMAYWAEHGAHLVQMIGTDVPITDVNTTLKTDWWSLGSAVEPEVDPMLDFVATSPWDITQTQIWWFSAAGHRYVTPSEWAVMKINFALNTGKELKPFKGTPEMFNGSRNTNDVAPGGAPTRFNITSTGVAVAA